MSKLQDYIYYEEPNGVIYHGDCLEILPLLDKVDLVLTDPPYGINLQMNGGSIVNDDNFDWLSPAFNAIYNVLLNNAFCLSFYGWPEVEIFMNAFKAAGFLPKSHIIFLKDNIKLEESE